jgi:hypothetical protein
MDTKARRRREGKRERERQTDRPFIYRCLRLWVLVRKLQGLCPNLTPTLFI